MLGVSYVNKIPGNFDENNSSKQQKFREFLHFLHTKFREFLRKKATSRCFFSKKFREFLLRKMAKIPGILKKKQCAQNDALMISVFMPHIIYHTGISSGAPCAGDPPIFDLGQRRGRRHS